MITEKERERRTAPRTGELWEFSNGVIATIDEISDPNVGTPEIAYVGENYFKFNAATDPMPVRKL